MTKKIIQFSAAMFFSASVMTLTSCVANDDNPGANPGDSDNSEQYVTPETDPTADQLTTTVKGKTYVFEGNYTGEGKALVARVTNPVAQLLPKDGTPPNEEVEHIILHNDHIAHLKNGEVAALIMVLAKGGTIAIADPVVDDLKALAKDLRIIISQYLEGGNDVAAKYVVRMLDTNTINRILMWTDNFDFSVYLNEEGRGDYMALAIFRDYDSYVAFDEEDIQSDYHYGLRADRAAEWINTEKSDVQEAAERQTAARMMAQRAGGTADAYVDLIAKSQDFTFDVGMQVTGPENYSKYHSCTLKYEIWTAYSREKQCDVYCMKQTVTAYNQLLNCGPNGENMWYSTKGWAPWDAAKKQYSDLQKYVYGPYMKKIYTKCELKDASNMVTIANYAPQNSTSGGQTDAYGFTFGLGVNAGLSASGPQISGGVNCSWSHTVSRFSEDLQMTASPSPDGVAEWTYIGRSVDTHVDPYSYNTHRHDAATSIQTTTCTLEQAWVWTVAGSKSQTVTIQPTFQLLDEWLTYQLHNYLGVLKTEPYYIQCNNTKNPTAIVINCPPRCIQTWNMSVESKAANADVVKIQNYLTDNLKTYCMTSSTIYTAKADHKKSYNEGKKVEEYDEMGKFLYTAKDAFTNNKNNVEIMRQAGKVGGLSDTDSYTIVWRQTDAGTNSDSEEFTFNMTASK